MRAATHGQRCSRACFEAGVIGSAGLDDGELFSSSNPLLNLREPNLMVTPHVAWASNQSIEEFRTQLVENLEGCAAGTPRNVITALDG